MLSTLLSRIIRPKDVIKHFRYSSPLKQKQIKDIKDELRSMSKEDIKKLLNTPLEDLSKNEFNLVLYAGTTFPEFGFPNKTIIQMKPQEFTKLKRNVNQTVEDMMSGKNVEIVQAGSVVEFEPGKLKMTDNPLLGGQLIREQGKEKISPAKTKAESLPDDEFYQPSFFFDEDIRDKKNMGGTMSLLNDDREQYIVGGIARAASSAIKKLFKKKSSPKQEELNELIEAYKETYKMEDQYPLGSAPNEETIINRREAINSRINMLLEDMDDVFDSRIEEATGYTRRDWVNDKLANIEDGPKIKKAEGGDVDEQMSTLIGPQEELPMEPDSEMEDNYLDFIIDEALSEEEEDMLMSKLEQDDELSILFDKVIEVASEFAGSGPVEGPGTGVSDSIPARLSDGEFVFTAKAVEEIGSDNLMSMMKDAEARADQRQGMANGGEMEEEETVVVKGDEPARQEIRVVKETVDPLRGIQDSNEIGQAINQQMLLDPDQKHVRS